MSTEDATAHLAAALASLGHTGDPELTDTPRRVSEVLASFVPDGDPPPLSPTHTTTQGPVLVGAMPFHSMCIHHLLPFFGEVAVAYLPTVSVVGLGSIPKTVQYYARQLQLQERLADQIADRLYQGTEARSLVVGIRARHLCIEMRGASSPADVWVTVSRGDTDPGLLQLVTDSLRS